MRFCKSASFWLLLTIFSFMCAAGSSAHDLVWPGEKLKKLFPQAESFEQKNLYVSDEQRSHIEELLGDRLPQEDIKPSIYLAVVRSAPGAPPRKGAAIMFIDAQGEGGKIEMGVVVNGKGEIAKIHIFENNEPRELAQQPFLKQFEGKRATDLFNVGTDITAPSGKERSAQAISSGARRGLLIITELFRKK